MCWSMEVSAAFALFDVVALAILWRRNALNDRLYCLTCWPIAAQEVGQMALWSTIGTGPYECSTFNQTITLAVNLVVCSLILLFTWLAFHHKPSAPPKRWRQVLRGPFVVGAVGYFAWVCWLLVDEYRTKPRGTFAGPHHHQVWPLNFIHSTLVTALVHGGYVVFGFSPCMAFVRPLWKGLGFWIPMGTTLAVGYVLRPQEWASIWCWSGFSIFAWALAIPLVEKSLEQHKRSKRH